MVVTGLVFPVDAGISRRIFIGRFLNLHFKQKKLYPSFLSIWGVIRHPFPYLPLLQRAGQLKPRFRTLSRYSYGDNVRIPRIPFPGTSSHRLIPGKLHPLIIRRFSSDPKILSKASWGIPRFARNSSCSVQRLCG